LSEHLAVALPARDVDWLKSALQLAVALEQAAVLPYIAATYSLVVHNYTAYNVIRSVAMEEMAHMATAANMLAAIGGKPAIRDLAPKFPTHGLPGGAEPDLFLCLAPLSRAQLKNFMRLEVPEFLLDPALRDGDYPTIAKLYAAIEQAIDANAAAIRAIGSTSRTANQIVDNIGAASLAAGADPVAMMQRAIRQIVAQGEGSRYHSLDADPASEGEASHYRKFAELYYGRAFQPPQPPRAMTRDNEPEFFAGAAIPPPQVRNLLVVPADGYAKILALDPAAADVDKNLTAFDQAYNDMMSNLDDAWNGPAARWWPTLGQGVATMAKLRVLGYFNIMKFQIPPAVVAQLPQLYPDEIDMFRTYTHLDAPVFYGPRFMNLNAAAPAPPAPAKPA
jgi:rubrerythrin